MQQQIYFSTSFAQVFKNTRTRLKKNYKPLGSFTRFKADNYKKKF